MRRLTLSLLPLLGACVETPPDKLTALEEVEVVGAVVDAHRTEAFAGEVVDLTTGFTIGAAYEAAAENLRDWVGSQLPCSTVTLGEADGGLAVVHMDLGTLDDACEHRGRTYAGALSVTLVEVDPAGRVVLEHAWDGVTDGEQTLTGGAAVVWDTRSGPVERQVRYSASWRDALGTLEGVGDLRHTPLSGDRFTEGFVLDGDRDWTARDGRDWSMAAEGVAARWQDPVPQAGRYVVFTPEGKRAELSFARQDDATVRVTLSGGVEDRLLDVSASGVVVAVAETDGEDSP